METLGNEAKAAMERLQVRVTGLETDVYGLRSIVKDLSDAMVVQAHLERKQSEAIVNAQEGVEESRRKEAALDKRVSDLVSAIGELISRIPPGNLFGKG